MPHTYIQSGAQLQMFEKGKVQSWMMKRWCTGRLHWRRQ